MHKRTSESASLEELRSQRSAVHGLLWPEPCQEWFAFLCKSTHLTERLSDFAVVT
jgi:hypothetical protein